jgi:hypothetical protein
MAKKKKDTKQKQHLNNKVVLKTEKIQKAPQTFIEDTFDIDSENNTTPTIIKNEVNKKYKKNIDVNQLIETFAFKNKLTKIKTRVEYEKSFAFLFDFTNSSKLYKSYYINELEDEYDLLLYYSVITFKKKMAKIQLNYEIYQKFEIYFNSLKSLYGRFKVADNTEKEALNLELKQMIQMSDEIAFYYFK